MTRCARLVGICVTCVLSFAAAVSAETVAESKIMRVTLYADRAEVVRTANVHLAAGSSEIAFEGLPLAIEADSVRVSARGVPVSLGAVELRDDVREPEAGPELAAAEKELRAIEDALFALNQEDAADKEALEFLRALRTPAPAPAGVTPARPDPQGLQQSWSFVRAQLGELSTRALARNTKYRELTEKQALARERETAAKPKPGARLRRVVVALQATAAGSLAVELSYVVPNAGWHPAYRATLDPAKAQVDLVTEGVLAQGTGEDWTDVELQFSTAAPARGVAPPVLETMVVKPVTAVAGSRERDFKMSVDGVSNVDPLTSAYANQVSYKQADAVTPVAQLLRTAYTAVFVAPARASIPADRREHRVLLRSGTMPVTLGHRIVPSSTPAAYVVARGRTSSEWPMLAGPIRVFAGSDYVGQVQHEETGPGAEIELPFGVDDRIAVKRFADPEQHTREGFVSKDNQLARHFTTRIQNRRSEPVNLTVRDRVPVSQDERIVVKRGDATTAGCKDVVDHPGLIDWQLTLAPGEAKEIVLEYAIRYPKDLQVTVAED